MLTVESGINPIRSLIIRSLPFLWGAAQNAQWMRKAYIETSAVHRAKHSRVNRTPIQYEIKTVPCKRDLIEELEWKAIEELASGFAETMVFKFLNELGP